jgi:hypothetical protein
MNCGTRKHPGEGCHAGHARAHARGASRGCGCGSHAWRRFQTREESVARLERYLEDLQKEAQAVEERIAALKVE